MAPAPIGHNAFYSTEQESQLNWLKQKGSLSSHIRDRVGVGRASGTADDDSTMPRRTRVQATSPLWRSPCWFLSSGGLKELQF